MAVALMLAIASRAQSFSIETHSDTLSYLVLRTKGGVNRWPLKFPVYRLCEGDIDGDGEVTLADAEAITDYLLDLGHIDIEAADVDGDGEITIADVTAIIQSIIEE